MLYTTFVLIVLENMSKIRLFLPDFSSYLQQYLVTTWKKENSTSIWSAQKPNASQKIQHKLKAPLFNWIKQENLQKSSSDSFKVFLTILIRKVQHSFLRKRL